MYTFEKQKIHQKANFSIWFWSNIFVFFKEPTIYKFQKGTNIRLILYTTDFEITIRDNSEWIISVDLTQSKMLLPRD